MNQARVWAWFNFYHRLYEKVSGNKYINNYVEDCHGELVMHGGHECLVDSNRFKGGTGGIRVNGTGHTISNNQFEKPPIAIRLMYAWRWVK